MISDGKHAENFSASETRKRLFQALDRILTLSREKIDKQEVSEPNRQRWSRILIAGIEAYGHILETYQVDELEERVSKLEEKHNDRKSAK